MWGAYLSLYDFARNLLTGIAHGVVDVAAWKPPQKIRYVDRLSTLFMPQNQIWTASKQICFHSNGIAICLSTRCFKFLYPEEVCIALAKRFGSSDCRVWYALTSCIWYLGTDCEATTETQSNLSTTDAHSCCAARSCLPRKTSLPKRLGTLCGSPVDIADAFHFEIRGYAGITSDFAVKSTLHRCRTMVLFVFRCSYWRGLGSYGRVCCGARSHQELRAWALWVSLHEAQGDIWRNYVGTCADCPDLAGPCPTTSAYQYQQFLGQGLLSYEIYRCSSVACCSPRTSGPIVWRSPHSGYDVLGDHRGSWHVHLVSTTIASALAGLSLLV